MDSPPLRYLSAADVQAAMPGVEARLGLAETTMLALVDDAQLPPKIGVDPTPPDSFAHAMPAWMRGGAADGSEDLLGIKWVVGFPENAARGLPVITATTIISDAATGLPLGILDAGGITALRTAAVSGVAISRWGPADPGPVAIIGAGVQARSHLPVVAHLLPGVAVTICDRDRARAEALAQEVAAGCARADRHRDDRHRSLRGGRGCGPGADDGVLRARSTVDPGRGLPRGRHGRGRGLRHVRAGHASPGGPGSSSPTTESSSWPIARRRSSRATPSRVP